MRVLVVANPAATAAARGVPRRVRSVLAASGDVELVSTGHRGHARELARAAAQNGVDVVVALGGDGTVGELVNGLLDVHAPHTAGSAGAPGRAPAGAPAEDVERAVAAATRAPALAVVPSGATNVLARTLGLARRPVAAAMQVAEALATGTERCIGVGHLQVLDDEPRTAGPTRSDPAGAAEQRWFVLNAGLGLDAAAVAHVERARLDGRRASSATYALATFRAWRASDRSDAPIRVRTPDGGADALAAVMVTNTDPWTYFGPRRLRPTPRSSFDLGLDVMGARDLDLGSTLGGIGRMLAHRPAPVSMAWHAHDQAWLELRSSRPIALQADGDYLGEVRHVRFAAHAAALRLIAPVAAETAAAAASAACSPTGA